MLTNVFTLLLANSGKEPTQTANRKLVWSDEFQYVGAPDSTKWTYDLGNGCPEICGWGNDELEFYTNKPENTRVDGEYLIIELRQEDQHDYPYTSARIKSTGQGHWTYGRFEIRAKLPEGLGTWPAIWMLPTEWTYGGWPLSGEIDIMEKVGYSPDSIVASAHTAAYNHSLGTHKNGIGYIPDNSDVFHNYILEWNENEYQVFVDDTLIFHYTNPNKSFAEWPFDQKFHLILNIAFGGSWGGKHGIEPNDLPAKMLIDYVRVYQ